MVRWKRYHPVQAVVKILTGHGLQQGHAVSRHPSKLQRSLRECMVHILLDLSASASHLSRELHTAFPGGDYHVDRGWRLCIFVVKPERILMEIRR
jgi:hypothetical protein